MLLICFFKPRLVTTGLKGNKYYNILLSLWAADLLYFLKKLLIIFINFINDCILNLTS